MPYCINTRCPHRLRTGHPAELLPGISVCPDCGRPLVEELETPAPVPPCPAPLRRRIAITVAALAAIWISLFAPSPFIELEALEALEGQGLGAFVTGPFSIGLKPFIMSFVLVEIAVLLFKPRRRLGDAGFRHRMRQAALGLGAVLCVVQGYGQALAIESITMFSQVHLLVFEPGLTFRLLFGLTALAGSSIWLAIADLISRRGLGNGFAVVVLASLVTSIPWTLLDVWHALIVGQMRPVSFVVSVSGAIGAFVGAALVLERLGRRLDPNLRLRLPTCGTLPLEVAFAATLLPSTLVNFGVTAMAPLSQSLYPGMIGAFVVELAVIGVGVPAFSALFYWRQRLRLTAPENAPMWRRGQMLSAAIMVGAAVYGFIGPMILESTLLPSSLTALFAAAIALDLYHEGRARWRAPNGVDLVPLEEHHDVVDALEAHADLDEVDGTVVQGLHYRSLTYFLGPFVPLVILGPGPEPLIGEREGLTPPSR